MQYEIKELGIGQILDQAVNLLKNHFVLLFGIALALYIPWVLIQNFVTLALLPPVPPLSDLEAVMAYNEAATQATLYTLPMSLIFVLIVLPITNAAIIYAIANSYLGTPSTVGESLSRSIKIIAPLLWTWLLQSLAIMGGLILLIIPGILFAFWFSLSSHVVVLEGQNGSAALSRSKSLMTGNIGTVFVLGIIVAVIQWGIMFCASLIPQLHLQILAQVILGAIAMIFSAAAFVVFYFSCRCKAEHFDLQLLAQSVGSEPPKRAVGDEANF